MNALPSGKQLAGEVKATIRVKWEGTDPESLREANPQAYQEVMERVYFSIGSSFAFLAPETAQSESTFWRPEEVTVTIQAIPPNLACDPEYPGTEEAGYIPVFQYGQSGPPSEADIWGVIVHSEIDDGESASPIYRDAYGQIGVYI